VLSFSSATSVLKLLRGSSQPPEVYRFVAEEMGDETPELCPVACHVWDTIGAQAAGCHGALIMRPHNAILPAAGVPIPDLVAVHLTGLADQIIHRWRI